MANGQDLKIYLVNIKNPATKLSFPLGMAYIARALEVAGMDFEVIDLLPVPPEERENVFLSRIRGVRNAVFGFGVIVGNRCLEINSHFAKLVRRHSPGSTVVFGGPLATATPELLLKHGICDHVVMGEGEERFVTLLRSLTNGHADLDDSGIVSRSDAWSRDEEDTLDMDRAKRIAKIADIDRYAPPAYGRFDMDFYVGFYKAHGRCFEINASRGCRGNCAFCFKFVGRGFHARSAESLVAEIDAINCEHGFTGFLFREENFLQNKALVRDFLSAVNGLGKDFSFRCISRLDDLDEETVRMIAGANFLSVGFGVESLNQKRLEQINKGTHVEDIEKTIDLLRRYGLDPRCSFILGFPDDTEEDFTAIYDFIRRNQVKGTVNLFTPLPRTRLFRDLKDDVMRAAEVDTVWDYVQLIDQASLFQDLVVNLTRYPDDVLMHYKKKCTDLAREPFNPVQGYECYVKPYDDKVITDA